MTDPEGSPPTPERTVRYASKSASSCIVQDCRGDTRGQMLACSPHWSFLSRPLQLELVQCERTLSAQRYVGNVRRADRERWKVLVAMVQRELTEAWAVLLTRSNVGPDGIDWVRTRKQLAEPAEAEA